MLHTQRRRTHRVFFFCFRSARALVLNDGGRLVEADLRDSDRVSSVVDLADHKHIASGTSAAHPNKQENDDVAHRCHGGVAKQLQRQAAAPPLTCFPGWASPERRARGCAQTTVFLSVWQS